MAAAESDAGIDRIAEADQPVEAGPAESTTLTAGDEAATGSTTSWIADGEADEAAGIQAGPELDAELDPDAT